LKDFRAHSFGIEQGFVAGEVFALAADGAGTLCAGTDRGLFSFSDSKWSREASVPADLILALAPGDMGVLWCGTYRSGLIEVRAGASRCYSRLNAPVPDTIFCCVAYGQNGVVWAGSPSGLVCYDGHSWTVYTRKNSGLPSNNVRSLVVGDAGEVWIGTDVGVTRFAPSPGNGADSEEQVS
jgi:ligand-binding sensor domain-containing protein